jgi:spermidine synthase
VRRWAIVLAAAAPVLLAVSERFPLGVIRAQFPAEEWSPYYRINYSPASRTIVVNLLGHQTMVSRHDPFPAYEIPYQLNRDAGGAPFRDILIIGAGSGNDVSRALAWAAPDARIDAVEIDPVIQRLGARDHPDRPYQDPRVTVHLGDGRNFLKSTERRYDLIVFALIDSLVLHSSVSNIRLESYLFTQEAIADVRRCLKPDGLFAMYNYFRQGWIVSRLAKTVASVFGREPLVISLPPRETIEADAKAEGFTLLLAGDRGLNTGLLRGSRVAIPPRLRIADDDWPFLYLRNPMIPDLSWRGIAVIGLVSLGMLWLFGWRTGGGDVRLHATMLLLGAGFMLLEAKAVVRIALIFGSTWVVNTAVFSVILVMILLANLWVLKRRPLRIAPYYAGLILTLALAFTVPLETFLGWPVYVQGVAASTLVLAPVLFAGVIFAMLFRTATRPEQALAWNTAGAIVGGLAETLSLLIGFRYLVLVTAGIYAASAALARISGPENPRP